jgi:hypothetical protein
MRFGQTLLVGGFMAALTVSGPAPVAADGPTSAYSKLNISQCQVVAQNRETGSIAWSCPGRDGTEIWAAEDDARFFVSFGPAADRQAAAGQTLPPFNRINDTLEWRLGEGGQPFATILRWFTEFDDGRVGQVLVVTRIAPDGVCHLAYVDALANKNANELARQAADNLSAGFDCGTQQPVIVGNPGSSLG